MKKYHRYWLFLFFCILSQCFVFGQRNNDAGDSLFTKAESSFQRKDFASAKERYNRYLFLTNPETEKNFERDQQHPVPHVLSKRITACLRIAYVFTISGRYDSALVKIYEGIKEIDDAGIRNSNLRAKLFLQEGTCRLLRREYEPALECFRKCLVAADGKSVPAADAYQNIGSICYFKADYENAILNYQKSWTCQLSLKTKDRKRMVQTLASLGTAYIEYEEVRKGLSCLTNAEKLLANSEYADSAAYAELHINMASAYRKLNRSSQALKYYFQGLNILGRQQISNTEAKLIALKGIASSYSDEGKYDSSIFFLNMALREIPIDNEHRKENAADIFAMIGDAFKMQQKYDTALSFYQQGLALLLPEFRTGNELPESSLHNNPFALFILIRKNAEMNLLKGIHERNDTVWLKRSLDLYNYAIGLSDKILKMLGNEGSAILFNDSSKETYARAIETAYRLWKSGKPEFKEIMFRLSEVSRLKILSENISFRDAIKKTYGLDTLLEKQKMLNHEIGLVARKKIMQETYLNEFSGAIYWSELDKELSMKIQNDSLIKIIKGRIDSSSGIEGSKEPITSTRIRKILSLKDAFLEYFRSDSTLFTFVITTDTFQVEKISIKKLFLQEVEYFQKAIKRTDFEGIETLGASLAEVLIEPVSRYLTGRSHLIVVPDEELFSLPFEALLAKNHHTGKKYRSYQEFHFLLKDYSISYAFSASAYCGLNQKTNSKPFNFLGIAPVFKNQTGTLTSFDPLASASVEVLTIGNIFKEHLQKTRVLTGESATKKQFIQDCGGYSHIHIATHCVSDEHHPENKGLAFTPEASSGKADEGLSSILWEDEIRDLSFHADLIVLGACATGTGRLTKTEGVIALPRSFYQAGTANVIFTLWNIPDRQTKDFMISFYQEFLGGKSCAEALREAKLEMLGHPETALPYLWAGFMLLGK